MERIINYEEIPKSTGQTIYLRMESDPNLYISLLAKGYEIVNHVVNADNSTIYVTGKRQDYECISSEEYKLKIARGIQNYLGENGIFRPKTLNFSYEALINHEYKLPFVLKNETQNGGREKFLICTESDYENLIKACCYLLDINLLSFYSSLSDDLRYRINYRSYLENNFVVQEYIETPTEFNTTVRLLTSSYDDLLYASLKYNKALEYNDETTLLGFLLHKVYKLGTNSIVSNTLSGGKNILIDSESHTALEKNILASHSIDSEQFESLLSITKRLHQKYHTELGIICGFDYIYDKEKQKWFLLEYHSRPMVGDYSRRQGISYFTNEDKIVAEGRVRATALTLALNKRK